MQRFAPSVGEAKRTETIEAMSNKNNPKHPMQPIVISGGTARFKPNKIVRYLLDNGGFDLNKLAATGDLFSKDDWSQFAQLIGYSVGGYESLSYSRKKIVKQAWAEVDKVHPPKEKGS